jgi:hypothetical protein
MMVELSTTRKPLTLLVVLVTVLTLATVSKPFSTIGCPAVLKLSATAPLQASSKRDISTSLPVNKKPSSDYRSELGPHTTPTTNDSHTMSTAHEKAGLLNRPFLNSFHPHAYA